MSNTGILKSSEAAAQEAATAFRAAGMALANTVFLANGATNLTFMDNMIEVNSKLNTCHSDFKALLDRDADSIGALKNAFDEFDKKETEKMEKGE